MVNPTTVGMPLDTFMQRMNDQPFELIDGEIIEMPPVKFGHSETGKTLYDAIQTYLNGNPIGSVYQETTFVIEQTSDWVGGSRVPDVMFIAKERLDQYKAETDDYRAKPLALVPDLVVEIISPTDAYVTVEKKIRAYLRDGVRLLWIIDPDNATVKTYASSETPTVLHEDDTLSGGDVLPDFELAVSELLS